MLTTSTGKNAHSVIADIPDPMYDQPDVVRFEYAREIGPLTEITEGCDCIGSVCVESGVIKAYDDANFLVGGFADEAAAKATLFDRWYAKRQSKGGASTADEDPPMLAAALGLAKQRGWKVFPARMEDGKKWSWLSAKYAPGGENWGMTNDPEQLRRNFLNAKWQNKCGIGVPTGWVNRIIDVEADTLKGHGVEGLASLQQLEAKYGKLPDTLMAASPTGSPHRIYNHPGRGITVISRGLPGYPGVDIKGDGGMFIAPPSVRADGEYRWVNDNPIVDAPQWLLDLVTAKSNGKDPQLPPRIEVAEAFKKLPVNKLDPDLEDLPPLPVEPMLAECGWLQAAHETGGEEFSEEEWSLTTLIATFLKDGNELAHEFGNRHEGYTHDSTEEKWRQKNLAHKTKGVGWPQCKTIDKAQPVGQSWCQQCPHLAKGRSPLNLAWEHPTPEPIPPDPSFADPYAEFAGPSFPVEVLPPTLVKFVRTEHRAMGADPSALAMAALAAVAGAIHAETLVRAGEGWWEMPILWVFLIGDPSTMKTPIVTKAAAPLYRIDNEQYKTWQQEFKLWKQAQQPGAEKTSPPPRPPRHVLDEITPEKVAEVLSRSPRGSLMVHDELASWIEGFERYNAGSSRGFFLRCWNGGTYLKDRVGRGKNDQDAEIRVDNLALCVLGGIQPDRLAQIGDLTSDGLLQRALPCLMRPAEREDAYYPVAEANAQYDKLIKSIDDAPPETYLFDPDALEVRDRISARLFKLEQFDGFSAALRGAVGKLKGYFARICLVLEVVKRHDPANRKVPAGLKIASEFAHLNPEQVWIGGSWTVSRETTEAAEKILDEFLLPHIVGLYDVAINGGQDRDMLRLIGDFILASPKDRLLPSDLTTGVRALRGQPEYKIREWAGRFYGMGWLQPEATRPGIPPKAWLVVPGLRGFFVERRRHAEAARAEAHAILKAGGRRHRGG